MGLSYKVNPLPQPCLILDSIACDGASGTSGWLPGQPGGPGTQEGLLPRLGTLPGQCLEPLYNIGAVYLVPTNNLHWIYMSNVSNALLLRRLVLSEEPTWKEIKVKIN